MIKKLINWLTRKNVFPQVNYETKFAFTCGGVDYYQLVDFNNTPAMRGLKTMVFYSEMQMKCSLEYLKLHTEAMDNILLNNKGSINIYDIKKLNDQLKQRLEIALEMELVYKIASVVFFPKNENITDYDFGFNARKVAHWKKYGGADFFLFQPLQELLPVLKDMSGNLRNYMEVQQKVNKLHLENLLQLLPAKPIKKLKGKPYTWQGGTPQN